MNPIGEKIKKEAQKISLSKEERLSMKELITAFMNEHPLPPEIKINKKRDIPSVYYPRWHVSFRQRISVAFAIILLFGGSSFAAEAALPGDFLYPIKIAVNENVIGIVRIGDRQNGNYDTWLAERRLGEVTALASEGNLKPETRTELESKIENKVRNAQNTIAKLSDQEDFIGAADLSERLETTLEAHSKVLESIAESRGDNRSEVYPIISKIRLEAAHAAAVNTELNSLAIAKNSTEAKNLVEKKLTETEKTIQEAEEMLGQTFAVNTAAPETQMSLKSAPDGAEILSQENPEQIAPTAMRVAPPATSTDNGLAAARQNLSEGKARYEAGDFANAAEMIGRAKKAAREAKKVADIQKKYSLQIEINWNRFADDRDGGGNNLGATFPADATTTGAASIPATRTIEPNEIIPGIGGNSDNGNEERDETRGIATSTSNQTRAATSTSEDSDE